MKKTAEFIVTDTETSGLHVELGDRPFLGGQHRFKIVGDKAVTIKKEHWRPIIKKLANAALGGPETKVLQNAKFDIPMYDAIGVKVKGPIDDTILMAKLSPKWFPNFDLESIAKKIFGTSDEEKRELKRWMAGENERRAQAWYAEGNKGELPEDMKAKYNDVPQELMEPYFDKDLTNPAQVYTEFRPYFYLTPGKEAMYNEDRANAYKMEVELIGQTMEMERLGHKIDRAYLKSTISAANKRIDELLAGMRKKYDAKLKKALNDTKATFTPSKDKHLEWLILKELGLKPLKFTDSKKPCFDEDVLLAYDKPVLGQVLECRKTAKLLSVYLEKIYKNLDKDDAIHCSIWQCGTRTHRYTMTDPPLQTIPKQEEGEEEKTLYSIRRAFIPRPGYRNFHFDYSQIEPTLTAYYSQDDKMMQFVKEGGDIHKAIADTCGVPRGEAKKIGLAVTYGKGRKMLIEDFIKLGVETKEFAKNFRAVGVQYDNIMDEVKKGNKVRWQEAMDLIKPWWEQSVACKRLEVYFSNFPGVEEFKKDVMTAVKKRAAERGDRTGYITTLRGRMILVPENEAYKGINYIIQGSAADVLKGAQLKVWRMLKGMDAHILLTIHDELVIEISKKLDVMGLVKKIKAVMEDFPDIEIPLRVKPSEAVGSWANMKKVEL